MTGPTPTGLSLREIGGQAERVTRIGFAIIAMGIVLVVVRVVDWVDTEMADIASVLAIVIGALMVAIDGERTLRSS